MAGNCLPTVRAPTSFMTGPFGAANFRNFELEVEANAVHAANSGVYFHTALSGIGLPAEGLRDPDLQQPHRQGKLSARAIMTGSLYGLRNVYKPFAGDDQWFKINVLVRGKNIQVRLDGVHAGRLHRAHAAASFPTAWRRSASSTAARSPCNATTKDRGRASAASACGRCPTTLPTPGPDPGGGRPLQADHRRGPP